MPADPADWPAEAQPLTKKAGRPGVGSTADAAMHWLGPVGIAALLASTFAAGGGLTALLLSLHHQPPGQAGTVSQALRNALYGELYCRHMSTRVSGLRDLGAVGDSAAAAVSAGPPLRLATRSQACPPLAGNSDVSVGGFELQPPFWRMVDIIPTFNLQVDTVSFYCERASTLGASVGIYGGGGRLLASSGRVARRHCGDAEWLDVPVAPEVFLTAGRVYYIAHLHANGTWRTARGTGNQFARTIGKHFYAEYEGNRMPMEAPAAEAWGDGISDQAALVVKSCTQGRTDGGMPEIDPDELEELEKQVRLDRTDKQGLIEKLDTAHVEEEKLRETAQELQGARSHLEGELAGVVQNLTNVTLERQRLRGTVERTVQQERQRQREREERQQAKKRREEERFQNRQASKYAFVMMAYTAPQTPERQIWGVLAMAMAIKTLSKYPLIVLTNTTEFLDGQSVAEGLRKLGAKVMPVHSVDLPSTDAKVRMQTHRWKYGYWKLQIWKMTQYKRVIWLDADAILHRGVDWLFDRPGMWAQRDDWFCKLNQPGVSSGILVLEPNVEDFYGLMKYAEGLSDLRDGDNQLINEYFTNVRHRPISLLSDVEAAYGQCMGRAPSPYLNPDGSTIWGQWNMPALVHKSGGWGNSPNNEYANACFTHNVSLQLYTVGSTTINVCQYHPLGIYWRSLFCEAAHQRIGIGVPEIAAYCDDGCWYRGAEPRNWSSVVAHRDVGDAVWCAQNATVSLGDYNGRVVGHPVLEPLPLPVSTS